MSETVKTRGGALGDPVSSQQFTPIRLAERMSENMSSYIMAIAILVIVVSPLLIPTAVTVVHALDNLRQNRRVTNRAIDEPRHAVRSAA